MIHMAQREYEHRFDSGHDEVFNEYWQINELIMYQGAELGKEAMTAIKIRLQSLIKKQPDYFDLYLLLGDVLLILGAPERRDTLFDRGYQRALNLILDDKGRWPNRLEWSYFNNRPLIRMLSNKADLLWQVGLADPESWRKAFAIYENLLRTNPNDNLGVRYLMLAMLERMTPEEFDMRFTTWNEYAGEVSNGLDEPWFSENAPKHVELRWWLAHAKAQGWE
jgi:hypothetical protein